MASRNQKLLSSDRSVPGGDEHGLVSTCCFVGQCYRTPQGLQLHLSYLLPPSSSSSLEEEPIEKKRLFLGNGREILRERLIRGFDGENPLTTGYG